MMNLLENVDSAYHTILGPEFDNPVPGDVNSSMTLVLFATRAEYIEYMDSFIGFGGAAGGVYFEGPSVLYTYDRLPSESIFTLEELVQHEYGHYLNGRFVFSGVFGDTGYFDQAKPWADEGFAELLGGLKFANGTFTMPLREPHRGAMCTESTPNLNSLLTVQWSGWDYNNYLRGWAFNYFLNSNRPTSRNDLFKSFRDNTYSLSNFANLAGVSSVQALEQEWHAEIAEWCTAPALGQATGEGGMLHGEDIHAEILHMQDIPNTPAEPQVGHRE
jgi:microbial collagenase